MITGLHMFEFPLSLLMALAFVVGIFILRGKTSVAASATSRLASVVRSLASRKFSAIILSLVTVVLAVEGTWSLGLFHHWSFLVLIALAMLSLGLVAINDFTRKSVNAFLCHAGLFMVLWGGFFGAPDCTDAVMKVGENGSAEHIAADSNGNAVPFPFAVALKEFSTEYYQDGTSPKQYTSTLEVDGKTMQTSVNHPCRYKAYRIYQSGYDVTEEGTYSILKLVRDPWIALVALGALMLLAGSLLNLKKVWSGWMILVAGLVLAVVFTIISVARISFAALPPALRSLWFVPHLIVYMLAYSIMALAVIASLVQLFTPKVPEDLSSKLLATSSSLLLVGMMCGAFWAKQAWGDYWTWDPKECWAAVTWLLTVAGAHLTKKKVRIAFTLIAFMAIQVTWYGVNYLPSSSQSLHTYNQK